MTGLLKRELFPFARPLSLIGGEWAPEDMIRVDECHEDGVLVIKAELPGIDPDKDGILEIRIPEPPAPEARGAKRYCSRRQEVAVMSRSVTPREERYAVAWALPPDADEQPDDAAGALPPEAFDCCVHCPACGGRRMQPVDVVDVGRCDRCLDCGRLWAVHDGRFELFLGGEDRPHEH